MLIFSVLWLKNGILENHKMGCICQFIPFSCLILLGFRPRMMHISILHIGKI